MQVQAEITFDQLIDIVKQLPAGQLRRLKTIIENKSRTPQPDTDFATLLRNGPTATKEQLKTIEQNRKMLSKWK